MEYKCRFSWMLHGATVNILTKRDLDNILSIRNENIHLKKAKTSVYAFRSREPIQLQGKFDTVIESKRRVAAATLYAMKETPDQRSTSILSYQTALELNLITMRTNKLSEQPEVNSSVSEQSSSNTANDINQSKNMERVFTTALSKIQVDEWIEEYIGKDIIEPVVDECTEWVSGLVVTPKPRNPKEVRRVEELFARLQEKILTVNPEKCLFNQTELWFYGLHLTSNGIKADPSKVDAIKNTAQPRDVKELRSFLGLSNYCSKFIQNYSTLTAPLRELL
ncbi:Hypothetical predicted protein [Paramuricea clavata]|uniref:Uncharacterized protein n=1 Tax=Paramuricea clavata TaxID=317549 RepID=A0A6S7I5Y3_PARCT|nr:Hypothetical predicted protein [Paramuricea clavata]